MYNSISTPTIKVWKNMAILPWLLFMLYLNFCLLTGYWTFMEEVNSYIYWGFKAYNDHIALSRRVGTKIYIFLV